jgi:hypothetical protein
MAINVSDIILKATTKCKKGFSCLSGKTDCMCKVTSFNPDHPVVIKPSSADPCEYNLSFAQSNYCLCPVRNDIYKRYKI